MRRNLVMRHLNNGTDTALLHYNNAVLFNKTEMVYYNAIASTYFAKQENVKCNTNWLLISIRLIWLIVINS